MVTRAHGRTITDGSIGTADLADGAVTAAKLSAADTAGSRAAIQAAGTEVSNTFYGDQQIRSTDPAATEGPLLTLERITEPAEAASAADLIGGLALRGLDSAAAQVLYGKIAGRIDDPTAASEDFAWLFATRITGALATRFLMGAGFYAQGLSDPGAGIVNANGLQVAGVAVTPIAYLEYRDEKAAGTDGGTFTSGAWQTRTLTVEAADAGGHGALASNQITLATGTYEAEIICPALRVDSHQAKLYNVTDAADTLVGTTAYTGNGNTNMTNSIVTGRFTIAAPKVFEVRHRGQTTQATTGFGDAANFGVVEVYTTARFWKVA